MLVRPTAARTIPDPWTSRWRTTAIPVGIVAAVLALYLPVLNGPFVFDDSLTLHRNTSLGSIAAAWRPPAELSVSGRPLVSVTFAIGYALHGLWPPGFRAVNLVLHALNGLLLYALTRRLADRLPARPGPRTLSPHGFAAVSAGLWVVHPLTGDAVAYITQRTELLFATALLSTLYAVTRVASAASPAARRGWTVAAVAACTAGMASKEVMVGAPLLALLMDRTFFAGSVRRTLATRWALHAGLWATLLLLAWLVSEMPRAATAGFADYGDLTIGRYALTQVGVVAHYLRLTLWPHPLVIDYFDWPIASGIGDVWPQAVLLGGLVAVGAWQFVRNHWTGFAAAWCVVLLAPSSSVVVIVTEVAAERRMYMPLAALAAGVVALVLWTIDRWVPEARRRPVAGLILVLLGAAAAATSAVRGQDFRRDPSDVERESEESGVRLWSAARAARPNNARAYLNLANIASVRAREFDARRAAETARQARHDVVALTTRGLAVPSSAFPSDAQRATMWYRLRYTRAVAWLELGRFRDAAADAAALVESSPADRPSRQVLVSALVEDGRLDEAARVARAGLAYGDDYVTRWTLGVVAAELGDWPRAADEFGLAVRRATTRSQRIESRLNLSLVHVRSGHAARAAPLLQEVLAMDGQNAAARRMLADLARAAPPTP